MSRTEARIKCAIWSDRAFSELPDQPRLLYLFLLTQPDLALCGVIPYRAARWGAALGWTAEATEDAVGLLAGARFVVADVRQGELLIRSFMRHDGVLTSPLALRGAGRAMATVISTAINQAVWEEYPETCVEWGLERVSERDQEGGVEFGGSRRTEDGSRTTQDDGRGRSLPVVETRTGPNHGGTARSTGAVPDLIPALRGTQNGAHREVRKLGDESVTGAQNAPPRTRAREADIQGAFTAWQEATGHPGAKLDAARARVLDRALRTYPLADVLDAVKGWRWSPHHRGENDRGTAYNDLGLLLRDATHIEQFRDWERGIGRPNGHRPDDHGAAVAAQAERARAMLAQEALEGVR